MFFKKMGLCKEILTLMQRYILSLRHVLHIANLQSRTDKLRISGEIMEATDSDAEEGLLGAEEGLLKAEEGLMWAED
jgi:hypothetical protein